METPAVQESPECWEAGKINAFDSRAGLEVLPLK